MDFDRKTRKKNNFYSRRTFVYEKTITKVLGMVILMTVYVSMECGCSRKSTPVTMPVVPVESATVIKKIHTERTDTVFAEIPVQSSERTTHEDSSLLETDYAESEARINVDGTLTHILRNKQAAVPVTVKTNNDTIYIDRLTEKPVPVAIEKVVERELSWWQRIRLNTWGWVVVALGLCIGWFCHNPLRLLTRRN